jgi:hypothetical protein
MYIMTVTQVDLSICISVGDRVSGFQDGLDVVIIIYFWSNGATPAQILLWTAYGGHNN